MFKSYLSTSVLTHCFLVLTKEGICIQFPKTPKFKFFLITGDKTATLSFTWLLMSPQRRPLWEGIGSLAYSTSRLGFLNITRRQVWWDGSGAHANEEQESSQDTEGHPSPATGNSCSSPPVWNAQAWEARFQQTVWHWVEFSQRLGRGISLSNSMSNTHHDKY